MGGNAFLASCACVSGCDCHADSVGMLEFWDTIGGAYVDDRRTTYEERLVTGEGM